MRPIKVIVKSKEIRNKIINQSSVLKDVNTIVRIMPDRSEDERKRVNEMLGMAKNRYRSPNPGSKESEKNSIDAIVKIMNDSKKDSVILGDANLPEVCNESYKACPYPGVSTDSSISFIEALRNIALNNM